MIIFKTLKDDCIYKKTVLFGGSHNNKFAILSVEAPGWQGVKALEYQAYYELSQRSQAGCIGA